MLCGAMRTWKPLGATFCVILMLSLLQGVVASNEPANQDVLERLLQDDFNGLLLLMFMAIIYQMLQ